MDEERAGTGLQGVTEEYGRDVHATTPELPGDGLTERAAPLPGETLPAGSGNAS